MTRKQLIRELEKFEHDSEIYIAIFDEEAPDEIPAEVPIESVEMFSINITF